MIDRFLFLWEPKFCIFQVHLPVLWDSSGTGCHREPGSEAGSGVQESWKSGTGPGVVPVVALVVGVVGVAAVLVDSHPPLKSQELTVLP